jgi:LysM repeat protein
MSQSVSRTIITTLLVVAMLPSSVFAAPPPPTTIPPAPSVPPLPTYGYPVYHVVRYGDNLTRIAANYGSTVWAIARANGIWNINYIWVGQVLSIPTYTPGPAPWPTVYMVRPGDTLTAIAWSFRTTVWAIAQANGIWNPNLIYVGQTLYIR